MSDGSGIIDVGSNSAPVVVDWNGDGVLDLLVGNQDTSDGIRLYINAGTATNPVLDSYAEIYSGGAVISWYRCCPQVYDMNGDGNKDLILGENTGKFYYYENQDSNDSPVFNGYEAVQAGTVDIDLYYGARCDINDWNEDGLPDIIASDYNGNVNIFIANSVGVFGETSGAVNTALTISPVVNPVSEAFSFALGGLSGAARIDIYDAAGRRVLETAAQGDFVTVGADGLPAGVYTAVARQDASTATCRIVLTY